MVICGSSNIPNPPARITGQQEVDALHFLNLTALPALPSWVRFILTVRLRYITENCPRVLDFLLVLPSEVISSAAGVNGASEAVLRWSPLFGFVWKQDSHINCRE